MTQKLRVLQETSPRDGVQNLSAHGSRAGSTSVFPLWRFVVSLLKSSVRAGTAVLAMAATAQAQDADPRPNECWGFVFGEWTPALDWTAAGHASHAPPSLEASTTAGAPRHDAAAYSTLRGPALVLYPTWWPVGVGITLERDAARGDTVPGIAYAFVADGRQKPPESRILAWRKACNQPPSAAPTRAVPDERPAPRGARAAAQPPRRPASRPR